MYYRLYNNVWFQKISIPPPRRVFPVWPPHPPGFSVPEGLAVLPPPPGDSMFCLLVPPTPWKVHIYKTKTRIGSFMFVIYAYSQHNISNYFTHALIIFKITLLISAFTTKLWKYASINLLYVLVHCRCEVASSFIFVSNAFWSISGVYTMHYSKVRQPQAVTQHVFKKKSPFRKRMCTSINSHALPL